MSQLAFESIIGVTCLFGSIAFGYHFSPLIKAILDLIVS
jgi:hypothetical protein